MSTEPAKNIREAAAEQANVAFCGHFISAPFSAAAATVLLWESRAVALVLDYFTDIAGLSQSSKCMLASRASPLGMSVVSLTRIP